MTSGNGSISSPQNYYGGDGDDTITTTAEPIGRLVLAGEGGLDKITVPTFTNTNTNDSITIFGDWGYGDEGSRYTGTQYGDTRLEKKLLGDSDIIDIGQGSG